MYKILRIIVINGFILDIAVVGIVDDEELAKRIVSFLSDNCPDDFFEYRYVNSYIDDHE